VAHYSSIHIVIFQILESYLTFLVKDWWLVFSWMSFLFLIRLRQCTTFLYIHEAFDITSKNSLSIIHYCKGQAVPRCSNFFSVLKNPNTRISISLVFATLRHIYLPSSLLLLLFYHISAPVSWKVNCRIKISFFFRKGGGVMGHFKAQVICPISSFMLCMISSTKQHLSTTINVP
jgi:hypothetical protein